MSHTHTHTHTKVMGKNKNNLMNGKKEQQNQGKLKNQYINWYVQLKENFIFQVFLWITFECHYQLWPDCKFTCYFSNPWFDHWHLKEQRPDNYTHNEISATGWYTVCDRGLAHGMHLLFSWKQPLSAGWFC